MRNGCRTGLRLCLAAGALASLAAASAWAQPAAVAFDFEIAMGDESTLNPNGASVETRSAAGTTRMGIFQHPAMDEAAPMARITFPAVELPELEEGESLRFSTHVAIVASFDRTAFPRADGVAFIVLADGEELVRVEHAETAWRHIEVDLDHLAGRTIDFAFSTDPLDNPAYDWAFWGSPRILIDGREPAAAGPGRDYTQAIADFAPGDWEGRFVRRVATGRGEALVLTLDPHLDLDAATTHYGDLANPRVDFAPRIVAGQGPDGGSTSIVRVLGRYGIATAQFHAFGPEVRGGVDVNTLRTAEGEALIVAAALADASAPLRIFTPEGILVREIPLGPLSAPPSVEAGNFVPSAPGGQIAVLAHEADGPVLRLLAPSGDALSEMALDGDRFGPGSVLARRPEQGGDGLLVFCPDSGFLNDMPPGGALNTPVRVRPAGASASVHPSAFGGYLATTQDDLLSEYFAFGPDREPEAVNVGKEENTFWVQWYRYIDEHPGIEHVIDELQGEYIRPSKFNHRRVDGPAREMFDPHANVSPPPGWDPGEFLDNLSWDGEEGFMGFDGIEKVWNTTFSHRQHREAFEPWAAVIDERTGLPKYTMLTRNNRIATYGEFDTVGFIQSTYAHGIPAMENLYVLALRTTLQELATHFRSRPTHFPALDPVHEVEIAVAEDGSLGDYNPKHIENFLRHLQGLYGEDIAAINAVMGTEWEDRFDAPRMKDRGPWDFYDTDNRFHVDWMQFQRYVVNRRIADSFRESLLAGFPPEVIKSHQIPDLWAIGDLGAFSDIVSRFTPMDYVMSAGVGMGFTRYSLWFRRENNVLEGVVSSGFDSIIMGEYQALVPDNDDAIAQLVHVFDNGIMSVHCMLWPKDFDQGYNASMDYALQYLLANHDRPRPGQTGGTGMARPFAGHGGPYDIGIVGAGEGRTGLLKSLDAQGDWQGAVYTVPFRTRIDREVLMHRAEPSAFDEPLEFGPFEVLDGGEQITVHGILAGIGALEFSVLHDGIALPGLTHRIEADEDGKPFRITFRVPHYARDLSVRLAPVGEGLALAGDAELHTDRVTKVTRGIFQGVRHSGGLTFDILD